MSDTKQVKVDNWGIYFLQRLKHFFNRTDYCDLTLQFQDNAQLKVHRLVLNACTEYFELLERTCEMYEDCLIMPDDLQADVVVPIVNFMYTGQLEFKIDLLEKLYQTSQIMNMPVLSKLLDAQRVQNRPPKVAPPKQSYSRPGNKRSYNRAFDTAKSQPPADKKVCFPTKKNSNELQKKPMLIVHKKAAPKPPVTDPRPTRYEVPEELDPDSICDESFMNISYESKPLMIHPETSRRYTKKPDYGIFSEASSSRKLISHNTTLDVVNSSKYPSSSQNELLFDDSGSVLSQDDTFDYNYSVDMVRKTDNSQLFDQVFESGPKVTIETKENKQVSNVDHAKIISEVLKKYPHLVNSNKNIKLKILDTSNKIDKKKSHALSLPKYEPSYDDDSEPIYKDVVDSKAAAKLISMGAENVNGPWICLICGTPGKALHFPSYFKFRRHLTEVHNEKPIPNVCEYCGLKSGKRNYILHHLYTKHGIPPPPSYHFPKCNICNYVALTEGFLVKHKASHSDTTVRNFRCNVCFELFKTTSVLLQHIQATGHKYSADRKPNLQCIYCMKLFLRETNLYAHLKTNHKFEAKRDGVVEDSDEELPTQTMPPAPVKIEPSMVEPYGEDDDDDNSEMQYQIQSRPDGNIQVMAASRKTSRQKILNSGFEVKNPSPKVKARNMNEEFLNRDSSVQQQNTSRHSQDIMINEQGYIQHNSDGSQEYFMESVNNSETVQTIPYETSSLHYTETVQVDKKEYEPTGQVEIDIAGNEINDEHVLYETVQNDNKTLAVLTTLESAHSKDMMIIPDDFSLAENIDPKNPNIVVVYSHQVTDANKQFIVSPEYVQSQILTSAAESGLISSSAVINQQYTITTPTTIINQDGVQSTLINQQAVVPTVLRGVVNQAVQQQTDQLQVAHNQVCDIDNEELPAIEIGGVVHDSKLAQANVEHNNEIASDNITEEQQVFPQASMEVDVQETEIITPDSNIASNVTDDPPDKVEIEDIQLISEELVTQTDTVSKVQVGGECVENVPLEVQYVSQGEVAQEDCNTEQEMLTETSVVEQQEMQEVHKENVEQVPAKVTEQLQNLTSEWSDDDELVTGTTKETAVNEKIPEIEESIENIQEEMNKDISEIATEASNVSEEVLVSENTEEVLVSECNEEVLVTERNEDLLVTESNEVVEPPSTNGNTGNGIEKISSLLNDWEENDSQDEQVVTNEVEVPQVNDKNMPDIDDTVEPVQEVQKNPEAIKTLVKDWDEDDE